MSLASIINFSRYTTLLASHYRSAQLLLASLRALQTTQMASQPARPSPRSVLTQLAVLKASDPPAELDELPLRDFMILIEQFKEVKEEVPKRLLELQRDAEMIKTLRGKIGEVMERMEEGAKEVQEGEEERARVEERARREWWEERARRDRKAAAGTKPRRGFSVNDYDEKEDGRDENDHESDGDRDEMSKSSE
jgi:hypothetical protein